jgi:hypothetical protein
VATVGYEYSAAGRQRLKETRAKAEAVAMRAALRRVVQGGGTLLGRHADVNKPFIGNEHLDHNGIVEVLMQPKAPKTVPLSALLRL